MDDGLEARCPGLGSRLAQVPSWTSSASTRLAQDGWVQPPVAPASQ